MTIEQQQPQQQATETPEQRQQREQNEREVKKLELQERGTLANLSKEQVIEKYIAAWYTNAHLMDRLLFAVQEWNGLGDVLNQYGVNCRNLAKYITPRIANSVDEQKRQMNTARNQQEGFPNRAARRAAERDRDKVKQDFIKKLD
jgi:hypothetical protein